jgi:hypothetical protein
MRLVPEAVFSENDFISAIPDVHISYGISYINIRNHSTGPCSTGYSVFHRYRFEIGAGTN